MTSTGTVAVFKERRYREVKPKRNRKTSGRAKKRTIRASKDRRGDQLMTRVLVGLRQSSGRGRRNSGATDVGERVARGVALDQALSHTAHDLHTQNSTIIILLIKNE